VSRTFLEVTILVTIGAGLALYVLLGGADFGGGVWDLSASGPRREKERALISAAIGPVWEANHVWLIFVVTALFAAFPTAFAALGVALYVPFGIAVAGIVLRGAAFAFRAHGDPGTTWQRNWTRVFGIASIVTPFVFGMCAAAIASGRIRITEGVVQSGLVGVFTGPLSWVAGALLLTMCAYLAATYLTVEAVQRGEPELEETFRRRAIGSGAAAGLLAGLGLIAIRADAPVLWQGMGHRGWPLVVLSAAAGGGSLWLMTRRRYRAARVAAAMAVASVAAGWGLAQWPYLIVPDLTISDAAAPLGSLRSIAIGYVVGVALLIPSLLLLFRVFKTSHDGSRQSA
jgi:cytochrome d ubiquinol oxidase subunit II